jgi:hypothetical protein
LNHYAALALVESYLTASSSKGIDDRRDCMLLELEGLVEAIELYALQNAICIRKLLEDILEILKHFKGASSASLCTLLTLDVDRTIVKAHI